MDIVRSLTDSWYELTDMCVNAPDPPPVMLRKILDEISASGRGLGVSEFLSICTYVTDVCVKLVSKNEKNTVGEMIEIMISYVLDRRYMAFVNCLYLLDSL